MPQSLYKKLGFKELGMIRKGYFDSRTGSFEDVLYMDILKEEKVLRVKILLCWELFKIKNKIKSGFIDLLIITWLISQFILIFRNLKYSYIVCGCCFILICLIAFLTENNLKVKLLSITCAILGFSLYILPFHYSRLGDIIAGFLTTVLSLVLLKKTKSTCKGQHKKQ